MRYKIKYYFNGLELERTSYKFDLINLNYPKQLMYRSKDEFPSISEEIFENSIQSAFVANRIEILLRRILKENSLDTLSFTYARNSHAIDGDFTGKIIEFPANRHDELTFKIIDTKYPTYNRDGEIMAKKGRGGYIDYLTTERAIIEKTFNINEYTPLSGKFTPKFWMVFYDFDMQSFSQNQQISGKNKGILSTIESGVNKMGGEWVNKYNYHAIKFLDEKLLPTGEFA
jgi:hypothetical protein